MVKKAIGFVSITLMPSDFGATDS